VIVIETEGKMTAEAGVYAGLTARRRAAVSRRTCARGFLVKIEEYTPPGGPP